MQFHIECAKPQYASPSPHTFQQKPRKQNKYQQYNITNKKTPHIATTKNHQSLHPAQRFLAPPVPFPSSEVPTSPPVQAMKAARWSSSSSSISRSKVNSSASPLKACNNNHNDNGGTLLVNLCNYVLNILNWRWKIKGAHSSCEGANGLRNGD